VVRHSCLRRPQECPERDFLTASKVGLS
jgi:hypothetical protein